MAKTGAAIQAGLENLGNTCYMNSVVQCLKRVNELKDSLKSYEPSPAQMAGGDASQMLTINARNLMHEMDTKGEAFAPYAFV